MSDNSDRLDELLDEYKSQVAAYSNPDNTQACRVHELNQAEESRRQIVALVADLEGQLKCAQAATVGTRQGYRDAIRESQKGPT